MSHVLRLPKLEQADMRDISGRLTAVSSSVVPRGRPESQNGIPPLTYPAPYPLIRPERERHTPRPEWLVLPC